MLYNTRHTGGGSVKVIGRRRRRCYRSAACWVCVRVCMCAPRLRVCVCVCVGRRDSARVHVLRGSGGG